MGSPKCLTVKNWIAVEIYPWEIRNRNDKLNQQL